MKVPNRRPVRRARRQAGGPATVVGQTLGGELRARENDLALSRRVLQCIHRIAEGLSRASSAREVVEAALAGALDLPGVRAGWISLGDGDAGFRVAATRGLPAAIAAAGAFEEDCPCRRLCLSGDLDSVTNAVECERLSRAGSGAEGLRYHACVKLWTAGRAFGILSLAGPDKGLFDDDDLRILHAMGNQVGVALERAELLGGLEAEVVERTRALDAESAERRRTEEALRESELLFRGVFKSRTDAVLVTTPERTVANVNPAAEAMFGYSLDELRGRSTEVFHVDHEHYLKAAEMFRRAFSGGGVASFGFEMKRKNGEVFDTEQTISLLTDDLGQPKGTVGVIRDITERQRTEDALRRAQVQLAARIADLEQALARVDQLHGILPICTYCKKVRSDGDSWQQVEAYVSAHSAVRFSHGACPDCVRTVMQPELDELKRARALRAKTNQ